MATPGRKACMCLLQKRVCLFSRCVSGMASRACVCVYSAIIATDIRASACDWPRENGCIRLICMRWSPAAKPLTQAALSVLVRYHDGAVAAVRTALDVKVCEQKPKRAALGHPEPPATPGVAGVGAGVVLRSQRAGLGALHRVSTAITWKMTESATWVRRHFDDPSHLLFHAERLCIIICFKRFHFISQRLNDKIVLVNIIYHSVVNKWKDVQFDGLNKKNIQIVT